MLIQLELHHILGWLLTTATALAMGWLLLRALHLTSHLRASLERIALSTLTGAALLSLTVFALGIAGQAAWGPFLFLALVSVPVAAVLARREPIPNATERTGRGTAILLLIPFAGYAVFYFLHAAAPEISPDGSYYHLGFVELYHRTGRLEILRDTFFNHMPQGAELLFLYAYTFGRHSAAALTHFTILLALTALVCTYSRHQLRLAVAPSALAALAVFTSPLVGWDATRAYVDVAQAAAIFGMFYLLQLPVLTVRIAAVAGLLAGFAFSIKYMGGIALPLGVALILVAAKTGRRLQLVAVFSITAVAVFAPWAIRNWIAIGNPISPFLSTVFPNPYVFPDFTRQLTHLMYNQFFPGWLQLPVEYTIRGANTQGILGPVFLLTPIALLLSLRTRDGRRVALAAGVMLLLYPTAISRYLIPALPFLAIVIAAMFARWPKPAVVALLAVVAVTSMPPIVDQYAGPYAMRFARTPTASEVFRLTPETEYLSNQHAGYDVARMVDRHVPLDRTLYSFVSFPEAYSRTKALMYYTSARAMMSTEILFTPVDTSSLFPNGEPMLSGLSGNLAPTCQITYTYPPTKAYQLRLRLTRSSSLFWTITGLSTAPQSSPLTAAEASRSPWYARYAIDENPVTLWSTRLPARTGDTIGFQPPPVATQRLIVAAPPDQCHEQSASTTATLEFQAAPGAPYRILARQPTSIGYTSKPTGLRTMAACELTRRGISYLLVNQGNAVAEDIQQHADEWRVTVVDQAENFILYSLRPCDAVPAQ